MMLKDLLYSGKKYLKLFGKFGGEAITLVMLGIVKKTS